MTQMLYDRIVRSGTIAEPEGVPDPQFALPSTINWMRALGSLTGDITFGSARTKYASVSKRTFSEQETNTILEQLYFSLHQLAALDAFAKADRQADVARMAIVTWYYGVYYAASAMIAGQTASQQQDHAGTANTWDRQIAQSGLAMPPFELRVSNLVEANTKSEIQALRNGNNFALTTKPTSKIEAYGACCAYLSGTAGWYRWRFTEDVRASKEFKQLGTSEFRTKAARQLRDDRLRSRSVGFMHQAFRYRGKANYREALFLGYGTSAETLLKGYVADCIEVMRAFLSMAGAFASLRLGNQLWNEFLADVEKHRAFSASASRVWA